MYHNSDTLILASGSPRRQEFLKDLGLLFNVVVATIKEEPLASETAEDFVLRMAREKAEYVAEQFPEAVVISGDTIVCIDEKILGKPQSEQHAIELLMELSGRSHVVRSSFCIVQKSKNIFRTGSVATEVRFTAFSERLARAYVTTGEPMDKAGAYGIQGIGGSLVEAIDGSYSNVVGLPLAELVAALLEERIIDVI